MDDFTSQQQQTVADVNWQFPITTANELGEERASSQSEQTEDDD